MICDICGLCSVEGLPGCLCFFYCQELLPPLQCLSSRRIWLRCSGYQFKQEVTKCIKNSESDFSMRFGECSFVHVNQLDNSRYPSIYRVTLFLVELVSVPLSRTRTREDNGTDHLSIIYSLPVWLLRAVKTLDTVVSVSRTVFVFTTSRLCPIAQRLGNLSHELKQIKQIELK